MARLLSFLLQLQHLVRHASASSAPCRGPIAPRVMIISMWTPEADSWHRRFHESELGNLSAVAVASPGLSMLFPHVSCTEDGRVCQVTVGEGEVNAAASMMALVLSQRFNLGQTYFLIAGIAGVNPRHATLGSVALSRFAVQVALQYEIDPRSLPANWTTGYIAYGRDYPFEYPSITYGTEVFELNERLRDAALALASRASLTDDQISRQYRARYAARGQNPFAAAARPPSVVKCDCTTSDVYFSGTRLSQVFEKTTETWTNGTGVYCMTAQEENATLEVLVRAAIESIVDFSRIIVMRTGSDFDRPPPGVSDWEHLATVDQNGFNIAIDNIYNAGIEIVKGIVTEWDPVFRQGIVPTNYIGDILGSLGGIPDFGLGSVTGGKPVAPAGGRGGLAKRRTRRLGRFALRTGGGL
ncbi:purine nucleoside permease (NUP) domain-containing protein [Hirsutella rhossiliensis]|uniref:Purine nucleoside permease (NUP) domain-containing protein n=1 Tax=Hirsutella rhossiliensis TaxID=111463 RepID=A0A9P8SKL5_9HYPO|nr:purine nucleoside permease (NUP) domain-containing protein [Hirsutella rhossiliensis]KAH0964895.1 purine nucleoside permease (NUP) domain-containing protein [Hirsutella rhossiliensis]